MQVATRTVPVTDLEELLTRFEEMNGVRESIEALLVGLGETELSAGQKGLVKMIKSYHEILFRLVDESVDGFLQVVKPADDPLSRFPLAFPEKPIPERPVV